MAKARRGIHPVRSARAGWTMAPEAAGDYTAHGQPGLVPVGQLWVPVTFEHLIMDEDPERIEDPELVACLMYAVEGGEIVLRAVYSSTHEVDEVLALLRKEKPLSEWKREAFMYLAAGESVKGAELVDGAIRRRHPDHPHMTDSDRELVVRDAMTAAHKTPLKRRRDKITDELLREVAKVYRQAVDEERPPTLAVAEHFFKTHSTAARWVGLARKTGHLGPANGSRGGEINA